MNPKKDNLTEKLCNSTETRKERDEAWTLKLGREAKKKEKRKKNTFHYISDANRCTRWLQESTEMSTPRQDFAREIYAFSRTLSRRVFLT